MLLDVVVVVVTVLDVDEDVVTVLELVLDRVDEELEEVVEPPAEHALRSGMVAGSESGVSHLKTDEPEPHSKQDMSEKMVELDEDSATELMSPE